MKRLNIYMKQSATEILMIDFLNPNFYDVADIPEDTPNKALLIELYERMNAQNERLWMLFTEMAEDPDHKRMTAESIKPRSLRRKRAANKKQYRKCEFSGRMIEKSPAVDNPESEAFEAGYQDFLKEEFEG